jgi:hypothetical protein
MALPSKRPDPPKTMKEIERYTKAADQARLAQAAMAKTAIAGDAGQRRKHESA